MTPVALSKLDSSPPAQHSNRVPSIRPSLLAKLLEAVHAALHRARASGSWGALVVRFLAVALALLGLAGIGVAAGRAPELKELTRAPVTAGWSPLSNAAASTELAALGSAQNRSARPAANSEPANCTCPAHGSTDAASADSGPTSSAAPAGDAAVPSAATLGNGRAASRGKAGTVLLNSADANELARLPSVGPKRALAILELRRRLGRFRRPSDLLRVKGIGPKTLARMLPQLVIDAPH